MKRYLAIVLLTALVLALCLPIIARYEICANCGKGRLVAKETSKTVWCSACNADVEEITITETCTICKNPEIYTYKVCGHNN